MGFLGGSAGKESACNMGDLGSIPGLGRSSGEGKGYPLHYSGLENSMDCIFHEVAKSRTRLSDFHTERSMKGFKAGDCQIPIYLWLLCSGSSLLCIGFSPVAASRGCCLVTLHRLLISMVSVLVEHGCRHAGFSSHGAQP